MESDAVRVPTAPGLRGCAPEPATQSQPVGADPSRGFTPGPWGASNAHTGPTFWRVEPYSAEYLNDGWVIANEIHGPDGEANARLIAAAPDLYAALGDFMENPTFVVSVGGNPNVVDAMLDRARAALAKARGDA